MKFYELFKSDGFKKFQETVTSIQESIGPIVQRIQEQLGPTLEQIGKLGITLGEYFRAKEQLDNILLDYDWPPILHLPKSVLDELLESYELMDESEFIKFLEVQLKNHLTEDYIDSITNDWKLNPLLKHRMSLLQEAVKCHKKENYYASVILLLSQVEGMVANGFYHNSNMGEKAYRKYLEKLFSDVPSQNELAIKDFILKRVLARFVHGSPINSTISRHAIMHGADTSFGTYSNSIKALLLIDYLQEYFGYVRIVGSNRYHIHGCHYLNQTIRPVEVSKYTNKFKEEGCLPCSICMGHNDIY